VSFRPDITVAAIIERDDRFLMVEEVASGRRVFNQPAGHLEAGESLAQAVIRETLEETAWQVSPQAVVGVYLWKNPDNARAFLRIAFAARCNDHEPWRGLDDGICQVLWMTRDELLDHERRLRSPMVLRCLDDYLDGRRYPLGLLNHVNPESSADALHIFSA
jgi:8-oxo-dGTP pyrophosphatase MutT (NUDIX family)